MSEFLKRLENKLFQGYFQRDNYYLLWQDYSIYIEYNDMVHRRSVWDIRDIDITWVTTGIMVEASMVHHPSLRVGMDHHLLTMNHHPSTMNQHLLLMDHHHLPMDMATIHHHDSTMVTPIMITMNRFTIHHHQLDSKY